MTAFSYAVDQNCSKIATHNLFYTHNKCSLTLISLQFDHKLMQTYIENNNKIQIINTKAKSF